MFDYNDEKESEYMTITEMLEEMSWLKAIGCIIGFYFVIGGMVLGFVYWYTR